MKYVNSGSWTSFSEQTVDVKAGNEDGSLWSLRLSDNVWGSMTTAEVLHSIDMVMFESISKFG